MIKFLWNKAEELERTRILAYLRSESERYHSLAVIRESEIKLKQKPARFRERSPNEYYAASNALTDVIEILTPHTKSKQEVE